MPVCADDLRITINVTDEILLESCVVNKTQTSKILMIEKVLRLTKPKSIKRSHKNKKIASRCRRVKRV